MNTTDAELFQVHTSYLSFFYTTAIWGLEILHLKVRKFATKVASRQNSVKQHLGAQIHILCVKLYTEFKITLCI